MTCSLCWRRRLLTWGPSLVLLAGLVWVLVLVVWYRPLVPCGTIILTNGQMHALLCPAQGPVWP